MSAQERPARTHEWEFPGGDATVTVETGGDYDSPDFGVGASGGGPFTGDIRSVFAAEILRLAGRASRAESTLAARDAALAAAHGAAAAAVRTLRKRAESVLAITSGNVPHRLTGVSADLRNLARLLEGRVDQPALLRAAKLDRLRRGICDNVLRWLSFEVPPELHAALAELRAAEQED